MGAGYEAQECWACGRLAPGVNALAHLWTWVHYRGVAHRIGWWPVLRSFWERASWRVRGWFHG